jgi:DnaK suppressor protein
MGRGEPICEGDLRDSEEGTMTKAELAKFKQILEAKQAELGGGLRKRDEIAIEKSPDAIDEVTRAAERELAIRNLDRESSLLRNVRAALRRIDDGSFGVCVHCEEDISPKRLNAVPWSPYCIRCQEAADRHESDGDSGFDGLLVNAA